MFSVAYVILPFSNLPPTDAIRASLARFQRGGRGDIPSDWLAFNDQTHALHQTYQATFTFTNQAPRGLSVSGDDQSLWFLDTAKVQAEMRRRELARWQMCFADEMDFDTFVSGFTRPLEREPGSGAYGKFLNPLGRWDWWDLGGRFDGHIIGDPARAPGRTTAQVSSGDNPGRTIVANVEDQLGTALGQTPPDDVEVLTNRNIELVATLLADAKAGRDSAYPGAIVLPPGAVEDRWRWLDTWPQLGPPETVSWFGLASDATWPEVAAAAYTRFSEHWAASIAYHF